MGALFATESALTKLVVAAGDYLTRSRKKQRVFSSTANGSHVFRYLLERTYVLGEEDPRQLLVLEPELTIPI